LEEELYWDFTRGRTANLIILCGLSHIGILLMWAFETVAFCQGGGDFSLVHFELTLKSAVSESDESDGFLRFFLLLCE
jgi:hypothetical protein